MRNGMARRKGHRQARRRRTPPPPNPPHAAHTLRSHPTDHVHTHTPAGKRGDASGGPAG